MEMPKLIEAAKSGASLAPDKEKDEIKTFSFMTVERRAITTTDATLSIANIARLVVDWRAPAMKANWSNKSQAIAAIGIGVAIVCFYISSLSIQNQVFSLVGLAAAVLGFIIGSRLPRTFTPLGEPTYILEVRTNDAGSYYFSSSNKKLMDEVRRLITDKINDHNQSAVYNINFEQGVIENMGVGAIGSVGAMVSGSNNTVNAAAGNGRVNTVETTNIINYSEFIPTISAWRDHFTEQKDRQMAARLDELERLLKSGTPDETSRLRLRDILNGLAATFAASSDAIHLFNAIRQVAGF
jgi:hypothetical protein